MSSGEPRIAFKAGRAFRREGTNFVDPNPTKGAIIVSNGEDGLLRFQWKNRETNEIEEDLILLPQDAVMRKCAHPSGGRVYVLKFHSSNQRHFFWMQAGERTRDREFVDNVNRLLYDPESVPIWNAPGYNPPSPPDGVLRPGMARHISSSVPPRRSEMAAATAAAAAAHASAHTATATSGTTPAAETSGGHTATPEELARMRAIIQSMGASAQSAAEPEFLLQDILTPANLQPLFTSHPELIPSLFPHLPSDLPTPPSAEVLQQIIASPQFRAAVRSFDLALASGQLQGFVRALGLPEEAGSGFEAFLHAIQNQANTDRMDTD